MPTVTSDVFQDIYKLDIKTAKYILRDQHQSDTNPSSLNGFKVNRKKYPALNHSVLFVYDAHNSSLVPLLLLPGKSRDVFYGGETLKDPSKKLGEGSFGKVKQALDHNGNTLAVKIISSKKDVSKNAKHEARITKLLDKGYGHVERHVDSVANHDKYMQKHYILMKYFPGAKLCTISDKIAEIEQNIIQQYILKIGKDAFNQRFKRDLVFTQSVLKDIYKNPGSITSVIDHLPNIVKIDVAAKIAKELEKIFSASIVHCDLKGENILYDIQTGNVYILDFGLSCSVGEVHNYISGTRLYIDPYIINELIKNKNFTKEYTQDIYALGMIFEYDLKLKSLRIEELDTLINRMTNPDPKLRPIIEEIIIKLNDIIEMLSIRKAVIEESPEADKTIIPQAARFITHRHVTASPAPQYLLRDLGIPNTKMATPAPRSHLSQIRSKKQPQQITTKYNPGFLYRVPIERMEQQKLDPRLGPVIPGVPRKMIR